MAWRKLNGEAEHENHSTEMLSVMTSYKIQIAWELTELCQEYLKLVEDVFPTKTTCDSETTVDILKSVADCCRYLLEVEPGLIWKYKEKAASLYREAWTICSTIFPPSHETRLGVALNYAICLYETIGEHQLGIEIAQIAVDDYAMHAEYPSSPSNTLLLLMSNLQMWRILRRSDRIG